MRSNKGVLWHLSGWHSGVFNEANIELINKNIDSGIFYAFLKNFKAEV